MKTLPFIVIACVALILGVVLYLTVRQRATAIRALAGRLRFHYIGDALPLSLSLRGTPFDGASKVWNVIGGECHKTRVIVFDCRIGSGKGSWRRTVIAAETDADIFGVVHFDRDLTVERSGDWMLLYEPKAVSLIPPRLMSVDEIEAHLNAIP